MRVVQFTGPAADASNTEIVERADPTPGEGEVLIDVTHAGINFKDILMRRGDRAYVPQWPIVPGIEVVGTVTALGAGTATELQGQRVAGFLASGGLAEKVCVPADLVTGVPESVDSAVAAAVPTAWATAELLLRHLPSGLAGPDAPSRVLVHSAAGGVGQALAALAPLHGVDELVGVVGSASRVDTAAAWGYPTVLVRDDGWQRKLAGPFDLVLDPLGSKELGADLELAAGGGTVLLFGNAGGAAPAPLPDPAGLMSSNVSIGGFSIATTSTQQPRLVADAMDTVIRAVAAGRVRPEVLLRNGIDQVPATHDALAGGTAPGKYVVAFG